MFNDNKSVYVKGSLVTSKEEFEHFDDVRDAFIVLTTKMKALLKKANFHSLKRACIIQSNELELSQDLIMAIQNTKNVDELFDMLERSFYLSWIDIRILEKIVEVSDSSQAINLITNYKAAVFSKRLINILPYIFSNEVDKEYYAKVAAKIDRNPDEMTVADLLSLQSQVEEIIMGIKQGIGIMEQIKEGCIEIHWYIPNRYVSMAYINAKDRRHKFHDLHLLYLQIEGFSIIFAPGELSTFMYVARYVISCLVIYK